MMGRCPECYSENNRVTPIHKPFECLSEHEPYICGTCRRCICIQKDATRGVYRWNFPFKSLEDAILYLRTAEYVLGRSCSVYELKLDKNRRSYKIFGEKTDLVDYLKKNKTAKGSRTPVYQTPSYQKFPNTKVRHLTQEEVFNYLNDQ